MLGKIEASSIAKYIDSIKRMVAQGAEGMISSCTKIGLLIHQEDSQVPLSDTTRIHAEAAVEDALK